MTAAHPARLAVGVIGTGRVGSVLGAALARAGHRVVAAYAVSAESRGRAERLLPGVPLMPPDDVARAADLVVIATPDDVLPDVVIGLAAAGAFRPAQIVVHVCGRYGLDVLEPATRAGAVALALHPVMTFAGAPEDLQRLTGSTFGVTAREMLRPVAEALVIDMDGEPVWVPEDARPIYHAALVYAANNVVTLTASAVDVLTAAGIEHPTRLLGPLIGASLDNALRRGDHAMTGPVSRGDAGTVQVHLDALRASAPELVAPYIALARLTAERALQAGLLRADQAEGLLEVLAAQ
ncbi:MAG: DUF2520 domain-containing protein [Mycobacteriales bacterium]